METYIGIAGDWHGNKGWSRLRLLDFAALGITKILHLGDFGLWQDNSGQKYLYRVNKNLEENSQTLYVTLGNHENYVLVSMLQPIIEGENAGWFHNPRYPRILYAPRGHRWVWNDVSFVSLGGGNSIDRAYRQENINWWQGEQIGYGDVQRTREGGHAEIMVAHDCPAGVPLFGGHKAGVGGWSAEDISYAEKSRVALRFAVDIVKPELYFHGHYHFFAEYKTILQDGNNQEYLLHSIGLDKDKAPNNIGVLSLPSKQFDLIDYKISSMDLK